MMHLKIYLKRDYQYSSNSFDSNAEKARLAVRKSITRGRNLK